MKLAIYDETGKNLDEIKNLLSNYAEKNETSIEPCFFDSGAEALNSPVKFDGILYIADNTINGNSKMLNAFNTSYNSRIYFKLKRGNAIQCVNKSDIIYLEIVERSTLVVTTSGDYVSSNKLPFWKEQLADEKFFSPHKSFYINLKYVSYLDSGTIFLAERYPVSLARARKKAFQAEMNKIRDLSEIKIKKPRGKRQPKKTEADNI